jgi:general stress protein 26
MSFGRGAAVVAAQYSDFPRVRNAIREAGTSRPAASWRYMTGATKAQVDRVWAVIDKAGVCMMTTNFPDGLRARPMEARPERDEGVVWFLTDRRGLKDDEIESCPEVCLTFVHQPEKVYLSLTGEASVHRDPDKAEALWNRKQETWWDGPEDPNLRVLRVKLKRAEMWDGPADSDYAAYEFAKARITGEEPDVGENRKVTVEMGS